MNQVEAKKELESDIALSRSMGPAQRIGKTGRHTFRCSVKAMMAAVDSEGSEIMTEAGSGWIEDMKKRFPHTNPEIDAGKYPRLGYSRRYSDRYPENMGKRFRRVV